MNIEKYIAKRLLSSSEYKSSISAPIIKIAIAAVAVGIVMMLIAVSTGKGLQLKIQEKISGFNGHIIISKYNDNQSDISTEPLSLNQKFYPKFTSVEGIHHVQAVATKTGLIRTEKAFEGIVFKGIGKDYLKRNIEEYLVKGNFPNLSSNLNDEVLISEYLANRLGLKLGDKFVTYFIKDSKDGYNLRNFKIVGIYNTGFQEFDANYVIGDIRHIQRINKWNKNEIGAFEVFIDDFSKIEQKGKEVYETISSTLDTKTIKEKYYFIFDWLKLFDFNIILIIVIMITISSINMSVALLVLILERTNMIGILKSLGADNWSIRKIFIYQSVYLIGRGLFIGNLVGILLLLLQKYFSIIKLNPENYYVDVAPVEISLVHIILINMLTILICVIVLLIPSRIISKILPAKSIKFN